MTDCNTMRPKIAVSLDVTNDFRDVLEPPRFIERPEGMSLLESSSARIFIMRRSSVP